MKAGDLVTLSAYANRLDSLYKWSERARQRSMHAAPMVGLIVRASPSPWRKELLYEVRWMEADGPRGRDGQYGSVHFNRKDLKFVSRS
jgi:hypothetical protein